MVEAQQEMQANTEENVEKTVKNSSEALNEFTNLDNKKVANPFGFDQRTLILIGVASVTFLFLMFQIFFAPKYKLLYSDLEQSDAAAISSYLEKSNIKFKLSADGSQISVSSTSVPRLRLELADKGMPKGGNVGFEIFDKTNLNISDFGQKINFKRALEGELARTISSLEVIQSAKVHLALAKKSLFASQDNHSKASVIIVTKFNQDLSEKQVKGIQHLVSSAVENLDSQEVQITDAQGNSLVKSSDPSVMQEQKMTANEQKIKEYENKLETNLVNMLNPILGTGNVLVNVSAEMNFDESEVNIEVFNPTDEQGNVKTPVIRSEKTSTELYKKDKESKFGSSGSMNEIPNVFMVNHKLNPASNSGDKNYEKKDSTKNYEVSRQVERIKKASGLLKKVSVAVVVNKSLNATERSTLRETIQVAAGLNMERGDQVIVTGIKFSSTPYTDFKQQEEETQENKAILFSKIKKVLSMSLIVVGVIVIVMLILFSLNSGIDEKKAKALDEILEDENLPILNSIDKKLQEAEEAYQRTLSLDSNSNIDSMKKGISQIALKDPKVVAQALHSYIHE